jgi:hypothetical protein
VRAQAQANIHTKTSAKWQARVREGTECVCACVCERGRLIDYETRFLPFEQGGEEVEKVELIKVYILGA